VARTIGSVATSTGNYLDAHPETNTALTTISQQQSGPQSLAALKTYFDANPQAAKDMQALQSPLVGLSARCQLPLTLPQLLGLLQGAQSPAGGLPGALPTTPSAGVPGTSLPAQSSPAAVLTPGTGPLPGPSATTPR
jgi:hemophore